MCAKHFSLLVVIDVIANLLPQFLERPDKLKQKAHQQQQEKNTHNVILQNITRHSQEKQQSFHLLHLSLSLSFHEWQTNYVCTHVMLAQFIKSNSISDQWVFSSEFEPEFALNLNMNYKPWQHHTNAYAIWLLLVDSFTLSSLASDHDHKRHLV